MGLSFCPRSASQGPAQTECRRGYPQPMNLLVCAIYTGGRQWPRNTPIGTCQACRRLKLECIRPSGPADDLVQKGEPFPSYIAVYYQTAVVLCDECSLTLVPLYEAAKRRIRALPRPLVPTGRAGCPLAASLQLTAQRIAFLRAMSEMVVVPVPLGTGPVPGGCVWCGGLGVQHGTLYASGEFVILHDECQRQALEVIRAEWLAQCMASCAMMLWGLLPEVRWAIGWFVCRLSAVGVEAAAANRCPAAIV